MRKFFLLFISLIFILAPSIVAASIYNIAVTPDSDGFYSHEWWSGGHYNYSDYTTNDIPTSYWYESGSGGAYKEARLTFDLSSLTGVSPDDITSVTFNMDIISAYNSDSSSSKGNYGTRAGGIVYAGKQYDVSPGATGWTSYDYTNIFKTRFTAGDATASFSGDHNNLPYAGAGFSFTSAEEGHPAFLQITTNEASPVPVPPSILLLFSGLLGIIGFKRNC